MSRNHAPGVFACEASLKAKTAGSGSKVSLVEQDGEVPAASVRKQLIGDVSYVITSFLKKSRMKPCTRRCNDIGGVPARWDWVPLKN